jgi:hypothetical protein
MRRFQVRLPISYSLMDVDLSLVHSGYEADMSSLVEVTGDVVLEKFKSDAWVMLAIAQRASLQVKIEACAR